MELVSIVGIGGGIMMVAGIILCGIMAFLAKDSSGSAFDGGLMMFCLGAEFVLLYLIKVDYLELGPIVYILFGCLTLVILLTFVRGIIPHKL